MPDEPKIPSKVVDLTNLDVSRVPLAGGQTSAKDANIDAKPYDPGRARETVRGTIAQALVWTLVGVIAAIVLAGLVTAYACHFKDSCTPETVEIKTLRAVVEIVMTPLIGLVGAVTGFYFGEKSAAGRSGN
jgi:hypothetical protein